MYGGNGGNCTGRTNGEKKFGKIVFYSDVSLANDNQVCQACLEKERCGEDDAWIGCSDSRSSLWFHKDCI